MEWREPTYLPGLEINRQGDVRHAATGDMLRLYDSPSNPRIRVVKFRCPDGVLRRSAVTALLEETFGAGSAEAAGLPTPNMEKVRKSRQWAEDRRNGLVQPKPKEKGFEPVYGKRRCTDCGRPTHNYRCERCWKKKRGYGFEDSSAAAKREKKEAMTAGMDGFTPSAKYGKSPPAPPPGEQKRLAPAMPAKGHARQYRQPPADFWMPRKRTKETPVSEQDTTSPQAKTYSQGEIARLAGVSSGSTSYALKLIRQGRADLPGVAQKVKDTLDRLGISAEAWTGMAARQEPARPQEAPADAPEARTEEAPAAPAETADKPEQSGFADTRPAPELMARLSREAEAREKRRPRPEKRGRKKRRPASPSILQSMQGPSRTFSPTIGSRRTNLRPRRPLFRPLRAMPAIFP